MAARPQYPCPVLTWASQMHSASPWLSVEADGMPSDPRYLGESATMQLHAAMQGMCFVHLIACNVLG